MLEKDYSGFYIYEELHCWSQERSHVTESTHYLLENKSLLKSREKKKRKKHQTFEQLEAFLETIKKREKI